MPKLVQSSEFIVHSKNEKTTNYQLRTNNSIGYTLIELLVVIGIISILTVVGFVNFNKFSSAQVNEKAAAQIQSVFRLAQANASSSIICETQPSTSWGVIFANSGSNSRLELICAPGNRAQKTYYLEKAFLNKISCSSSQVTYPATFTFSTGAAKLTFVSRDSGIGCSDANTWTIELKNTLNNSLKNINITKGGAVNVQ